MTAQRQLSLDDYLNLDYPLSVIADSAGGYVAVFPDLPGCMAQADDLGILVELATEARRVWITGEFEDGHVIPLPSYPEEYSGKFNVRLPRSLHRKLAETAEREGVSLNQYVMSLLSEGDALARVEHRLDEVHHDVMQLHARMESIQDHIGYQVSQSPRSHLQLVKQQDQMIDEVLVAV